MDDLIEVSLVLRTKNEEKELGRVLRAIASQKYPGKYEIIIVDSGSSDETPRIASGFGARFHTIDRPFSYGYALNYGQSVSNGRIIVFLSAHCEPVDEYWLKSLTDPFLDSGVGAVYGRQIAVRGKNPAEEFELEIFFPPDKTPKAVFSNANCAVRKVLLQAHPFNEEIAYGEDFLWRKKLPAQVNVAYSRQACVYHSHPNTLSYWTGHHERVGLATAYLQKKEGIDNFYARKGGFLKQALSRFVYLWFFLKKGYLAAFLTFPALEAARCIFYFKGLRSGRKKYS